MTVIKPGLYRHYKGNMYEVLFLGKDNDTLEEIVVYRGLYKSKEFGDNPVWVRSRRIFLEKVDVNGKK